MPTITLTKQALRAEIAYADLVSALNYVSKGLPKRPTTGLQVLSGVLLETTHEGELVLSTFDYECAYRQTVAAHVGAVGRALLPAKFVADMVKKLKKADTITLSVSGGEGQITGAGVTYTVETLPIDDYPALPTADGDCVGGLSVEQIARAADVTLAAGKDNTRPVLTGVKFDAIDGRLHLVATDRYRLSAYDTGNSYFGKTFLVPANVIKTVAANFKGHTLITRSREGAEYVTFTTRERSLSARLIDGQFPDWQRLMPATTESSTEVDVAAFTEAIDQVSAVAARTAPITLTSSGTDLVLEASNDDGRKSTARKALTAECKGITDEVVIRFNPDYLTDGLKAVGGKTVGGKTVRISYAVGCEPADRSRKPAVLTAGDDQEFRYLLMPVRVH